MAEGGGGSGAPYPDPDPDPDPDTGNGTVRARLEVAFAAYELAELARTAVPVAPGGAGSPLADAIQVLAAAHRFYEAAARFERVREDGAAASADPRGEASWWQSYLTVAPLEAARDLDDWVLRHGDGDPDRGTAPVSGALFRRTGG
ncbi:hypothetical protein [Streptomyces sp. NPDC006645]|uniref:hypothetical protein n=1 Tax=unclassified Streptomyces TaxID=2593676 RepID=UPI0033AFFAA4